MTEMTPDLYKAILAMDAYNRGYGAAIKFGTAPDNSDSVVYDATAVGRAVVYDDMGDAAAKGEGFYGIAYQFKDSAGNVTETVISYRGTDTLVGNGYNGGSDFNNGFAIGSGDPYSSSQGLLAIAFYLRVASTVYGGSVDPHSSTLDVSFTGHSLGGGLAGLVGVNDNHCAIKSKVA